MLKAILLDAYGTLFDTGTGSVDAVRDILHLNGREDLSPISTLLRECLSCQFRSARV